MLCVLQIKSVKAVESVHHVTVTITKGCIDIKGLQGDVSEATFDIQKILARVREEKFAGILRAEVQHCNNRNFKLLCTCQACTEMNSK